MSFCKKCGNVLTDGAKFCGKCGEPAPPVQPFAEPAPAAETIQINNQYSQPPKKKKTGRIVALSVLAVIVVLAAVLLLNMRSIRASMLRWGDPVKYFRYIEQEASDDVIDAALVVYENAVNNAKNPLEGTSSSMKFTVGKDFRNFLPGMLGMTADEEDLAWMDHLGIDSSVRMKDDLAAIDLDFIANGTLIVGADMVMDMQENAMYLTLPELSEQSIRIDLAEIYGMDSTELYNAAEIQALYAAMAEAMPDAKTLEKLADKYMGILLEHVDHVEKAEETCSIQGIEQNVLTLEATISEENAIAAMVQVMQEMRTDKDVEKIIRSLAELDVHFGEEINADEFYEEFQNALDMAIESAEYEYAGCETLYLKDYIDRHGKVIGRRISTDYSVDAGYLILSDGKEFAFEAGAEDMKISGEGNKDGSTWKLYADEQELVVLRVSDWQNTNLKKQKLDFTASLSLGRDVVDEMTYNMDNPMIKTILMNAALTIDVDADGDASNVVLGLQANGMNVIQISAETTAIEAGKIEVPSSSLEGTDDMEMMQWASSLDVDRILKNLEAAGIPREILDMVG